MTNLVSSLREARKQLEEMNATAFDGPPGVSLYSRAADEIDRLQNLLHKAAAAFTGGNEHCPTCRRVYNQIAADQGYARFPDEPTVEARAFGTSIDPPAQKSTAEGGALYTTRHYPCGCRANGPGDVPAYCPEHGHE